ncbi:MAG: cytochrome c biogenesis protein DipZ [Candidatus Saccharimonas sp.]|nr:cytochrome c biogenesis protein DipZ [Candidatus Saccharimonas sp.]
MLLTALLSYVAGLLTALAPCVLPLLPIILGGSLSGEKKDKWRPYIITASLVVSLILFTLLLKVSTIFIGIDPKVWAIGSGVLVIALGLFMLFPNVWAQMIGKLGIEHRSQGLLGKAYKQENSILSALLIGAALGPIFSSCSPTYAWVIATVLPSNTLLGMIYLTSYVLGVATALLVIALMGRRLLERIKWASDPKGLLQRGIAILFILVGVFVATGLDKKVQTYLVEKDFLNIKFLEEKLVPVDTSSSKANSNGTTNKEEFNVTAYTAPEFKSISAWINSDSQTIDSLRGKVVLVDFWTYSCINCQRTQPYLNAWYDKYKDNGLVIIGVHAPEFAFEKVVDNVKDAVFDANITYPIALDNEFATWQAYENRFWPAKYLIDKDGQVRYTHFGEGNYAETENIIQTLLKESGQPVSDKIEANLVAGSVADSQTPETYLGFERFERFANVDQVIHNKIVNYTLADGLEEHNWSLGGQWQINDESSQSLSDNSQLRINFSGKEVYLVMSGQPGARIGVSVEGLANPGGIDVNTEGQVIIDGPRLYKIVHGDNYLANRQLTLTIPTGTTVNAFTFGG